MTEQPSDAEIGARIREIVELGDAEDFWLIEFHTLVADVPGPVGSLLRMIAHVHTCFEEARALYGTTEGEANRIFDGLGPQVLHPTWQVTYLDGTS